MQFLTSFVSSDLCLLSRFPLLFHPSLCVCVCVCAVTLTHTRICLRSRCVSSIEVLFLFFFMLACILFFCPLDFKCKSPPGTKAVCFPEIVSGSKCSTVNTIHYVTPVFFASIPLLVSRSNASFHTDAATARLSTSRHSGEEDGEEWESLTSS